MLEDDNNCEILEQNQIQWDIYTIRTCFRVAPISLFMILAKVFNSLSTFKHTYMRFIVLTQLLVDDHLLKACYELFIAGVDTTLNTLNWTFLYLLNYPEIQVCMNILTNVFPMCSMCSMSSMLILQF